LLKKEYWVHVRELQQTDSFRQSGFFKAPQLFFDALDELETLDIIRPHAVKAPFKSYSLLTWKRQHLKAQFQACMNDPSVETAIRESNERLHEHAERLRQQEEAEEKSKFVIEIDKVKVDQEKVALKKMELKLKRKRLEREFAAIKQEVTKQSSASDSKRKL
jgi:hypothetical protein